MHNSSVAAFKIFSSNLNITCLCMDIWFFLGWSLFGFLNVQVDVLGFHQTWEFSIKLETYSNQTTYSNIFSALQFFSFPSGIPRTQMLDSQVLRALFTVFFFFTLRCSAEIISISLFSSLLTLPLSFPICSWVHPMIFKILLTVFFISTILIWFFFIPSISLQVFSILIFVYNCSSECFYNSSFKVLII